jgi:hypothetical protein
MTNERITQQEAEALAKKAVGDYLTACNLQDPSQIGDVLMKLCSVAGVLMANTEGSAAAFDRLLGTAQFVLKTMPASPAKLEKLQ